MEYNKHKYIETYLFRYFGIRVVLHPPVVEIIKKRNALKVENSMKNTRVVSKVAEPPFSGGEKCPIYFLSMYFFFLPNHLSISK